MIISKSNQDFLKKELSQEEYNKYVLSKIEPYGERVKKNLKENPIEALRIKIDMQENPEKYSEEMKKLFM
ncbi:hypothetical protein [Campylobacter fetus]|uniref:hypothetical protein n=1 Tax=Campylobacter fetus TaxID=196 RepID=UPI0008189C3E|nr:hypothetical protein [Campylobacter fetus]OCR93263.1 hypothetical protein CFT12S02263_01345 [Campylobacter fetus subsp. testudinum]